MDDLVDKAIYDYLYAALSLLDSAEPDIRGLYFSHQNGVKLTSNYILITQTDIDEDINPEQRQVYNEVSNPDKLIQEFILYRNRYTYTLDIYGEQVLRYARRLKSILYSSVMIEKALELKLGFNRYGTTRKIPDVLGQQNRERATFDLLINFTTTEWLAVETIGQVGVVGETDSGAPLIDVDIQEPNYTP